MAVPPQPAVSWRCVVRGALLPEPYGDGRPNQAGSGSQIVAATVAEQPASLRHGQAPDRPTENPDRAGTKSANETARSEPDARG
jgi:hypothetical protein